MLLHRERERLLRSGASRGAGQRYDVITCGGAACTTRRPSATSYYAEGDNPDQ